MPAGACRTGFSPTLLALLVPAQMQPNPHEPTLDVSFAAASGASLSVLVGTRLPHAPPTVVQSWAFLPCDTFGMSLLA